LTEDWSSEPVGDKGGALSAANSVETACCPAALNWNLGEIEPIDTFVVTDTEQAYEALEAPYGCTSYRVDVNLDMRKENCTPLDTALKDRGNVACGQLRVNCSHTPHQPL
jgi:hypothetical protein